MPTTLPRLTLVGAIVPISGYGMHLIQIARDVARLAPAYVSIRATHYGEIFGAKIDPDIRSNIVQGIQPEPWELLLHPPNLLPTPSKKTAYFTMWESTKLPPFGVTFLNKAKVVIVPSRWNESCFTAEGVTSPVRVVPLGIKPEIFYPKPPTEEMDALCIFGTGGRMAHGGARKGLNEVMEAFQKAFPRSVSDVRLKVKCFPDCNVDSVTDPRIMFTKAYLNEPQMGDWFHGIHCFVSGAKAEGWGLMQHQALATGRPLISVNFGGVTEFFNSTLGYVIPYRLAKATGPYEGCGYMAEPSIDHMVDAMRHVYYNRHQALVMGERAASAVQHLTWENSNQQLVNVLREFGAL